MMANKQIDFSGALSEEEHKIQKYLDYIKREYLIRVEARALGGLDEISQSMVDEFNRTMHVDILTKYYRVVIRNSVHSFIVKRSDEKFMAGDVLKAATFAAPAKNFTRANINDGNYMNIGWTGA